MMAIVRSLLAVVALHVLSNQNTLVESCVGKKNILFLIADDGGFEAGGESLGFPGRK